MSKFIAFTIFVSTAAQAQETSKELAVKASDELRLLTSFQTLERATSQMDHFLTYGIVSSTGGWGVLEFVDTTDYKNAHVIRSTAKDLQVETARAMAAIERSKTATQEDKDKAHAATAAIADLYELADEISDALNAEAFEAARMLYREKGQKAYSAAIIASQSSISLLQKRLSKTILKIRVAK